MDDYYSLLGIDADASVDEKRGAYPGRKDGLDTASDTGKADAAALNKAWNVLSDPYQRGRYDERRAEGDDDEDEVDDYGDDVPATRTRASRSNARTKDGKNARTPPQPTITLPAGLEFATPKKRLI